jgi:hypothetical protein
MMREWIHRWYYPIGGSNIFLRAKCVDRPDLGGVMITLDLEIDDDPALTELFGGEDDSDCQP